jgi:predicted membrane chloride channel (bestrophin family)
MSVKCQKRTSRTPYWFCNLLDVGVPLLTCANAPLRKSLAKTVAAIAIALFWCISAVGATIGTTVGVTTLATAINAVTSTPAAARRYWRGRRGWGWGWGRRRRRRRRYWY